MKSGHKYLLDKIREAQSTVGFGKPDVILFSPFMLRLNPSNLVGGCKLGGFMEQLSLAENLE